MSHEEITTRRASRRQQLARIAAGGAIATVGWAGAAAAPASALTLKSSTTGLPSLYIGTAPQTCTTTTPGGSVSTSSAAVPVSTTGPCPQPAGGLYLDDIGGTGLTVDVTP